MASVGSLAYAEDENKHILGIKAVQSPGPVAERERTNYCCHVLECDSEVTVMTMLTNAAMLHLPHTHTHTHTHTHS